MRFGDLLVGMEDEKENGSGNSFADSFKSVTR